MFPRSARVFFRFSIFVNKCKVGTCRLFKINFAFVKILNLRTMFLRYGRLYTNH